MATKKKAKKKQDKLNRREDRKTNNNKGKSLEEMLVYTDEYGNLTDVPPEKQVRDKPNTKNNRRTPESDSEDQQCSGVLAMFNTEKNYGFITEKETGDAIFVHGSNLLDGIKVKDKVSFRKEKNSKGYAAMEVRIVTN